MGLTERAARLSMSQPRLLFVITVFNGEDVVPWCLRSGARAAARSKATTCDVLILDDASTKPGFSEQVADLCAELGIQYYRSPRNLGIPRNVNLGLLRAVHGGYDYVLVANSDVLFGAETIDRMVEVIASDEQIGSVTAWSNNVSIYSLPNLDAKTNLEDQHVVDWVADTCHLEFGAAAVDIPAGLSFCILIPTPVIRRVGMMDPVFGRGYCEETDWTLRSQALGYRIALAPSAFLYHRGQASNLDAGLLASGHTSVPAHERIVDLRYPLVREQVSAFINSEILDVLWNSARRAILVGAAQQFGYTIEIGVSPSVRQEKAGPRVTFERASGSLVAIANYLGFRLALPGAGSDELIPSVMKFFGRAPDSIRLADHSALASEAADALIREGFAVDAELGYPVDV